MADPAGKGNEEKRDNVFYIVEVQTMATENPYEARPHAPKPDMNRIRAAEISREDLRTIRTRQIEISRLERSRSLDPESTEDIDRTIKSKKAQIDAIITRAPQHDFNTNSTKMTGALGPACSNARNAEGLAINMQQLHALNRDFAARLELHDSNAREKPKTSM